MVRHIILWQMKDELTQAQKEEAKAKIKEQMEDLAGKVPGLEKIQIIADVLPSSNVDLMLDCTLADEKALENYAVNPLHVAIKDGLIMPNVKSRYCIDYTL